MSSDARIRKLRQYIPFLKRRQDQLISRGEVGESDKLKNLITVISNKAGELNPGVLERCERVCEDLYSKFGKREDDIKPSIVHELRRDPRLIPHERVSTPQNQKDETPRSPSPEESNRSFNAPRPIPERRSDGEMWPQQMPPGPYEGPSPFSRDVDVDYRQPWGPGPSSFPKRESRFDRYTPSPMERQWEPRHYERPPFASYERLERPPYGHPPFQPQSFYRPHHEPQFQRPYQPAWSDQRWDSRGHYGRPPRPQGGPPRRDDPRSRPHQKSPQQPRKHPPPGPVKSSPKTGDASKEKPVLKEPTKEQTKEQPKEQTKEQPKEQTKDQPKEQTKDQPKEQTKEQKNVTETEASETRETQEKKSGFVSPLGNLYTDAPKPAQTGKGYGLQNYKIPIRKKSPASPTKKTDEAPHVAPEDGAEAPIVREIIETEPSQIVSDDTKDGKKGEKEEQERKGSEELKKKGNELQEKKESEGQEKEKNDEDIPLEIVESFLKKRLPSTQAQSVLECLKSSSKEPVERDAPKEPADVVIDATVTSTSETHETGGPADGEEHADRTDNEPESCAKQGRKTGRKKGGCGGELKRLQEDLTDLMKPIDLGVRRTRAKTNPEPKPEPKKPETRTRKRKNTAPEAGEKRDEGNADERDRASPDGPGKSKKRKKIFQPTRLSLRGKRSMYENEDEHGDDYFQCRECPYFGQKIVHHYVNEHGSVEIPYVAVPEAEWERIVGVRDMQLHVDDSLDLKWIPSRPRYTTPVSCKLCSFSTCKRGELIEHLIGHALPEASYRCSVCGASEASYFDLLDHLGAHTGEYRYRCNYCDFRCCDRKAIKGHMVSVHESQDQLFYLMEIPDVDKLCVYGYACTNCHYYQMSEEHLRKHVKLHDKCKEYVRFSMMQAVDKSGADGVFVCPALETVASKEVVSENELAETLRIGETSWIESLAEKLKNPEQQVSSRKENNALSAPPRADKTNLAPQTGGESKARDKKEISAPPAAGKKILVPQTSKEADERDRKEVVAPPVVETNNSTLHPGEEAKTHRASDKTGETAQVLEDKTKIERKSENAVEISNESPGERSTPVKGEGMSEELDDSVIVLDQTPKKTVVVDAWKKNSLLETTISKLAGKLGDGSEALLAVVEENGDEEDAEKEDCDEEDCDEESLEEEEEEEDEESCEEADEQTNKQLETSLSSFLKIESVMSLNDEDVECLDPLDDVIIYSNVVLRKDEVTFPFSAEHDRSQMILRLKTPETYKKMTERPRLICFFKCVAFKCFFTCDSPADFGNHLKWHSKMYLIPKTKEIPVHRMLPADCPAATLTFPDFLLCAYCPFGGKTAEELVQHVQSRHRDCSHQCSVCLFRGWRPKAVALHILTAHSGMWAPVLACPGVKIEADVQVERFASLKEAPPYRCLVEHCKFACHHNQTLVAHLSSHSDARAATLRCPDCSERVEPLEDFQGVFAHLRTHSKGFYQCSFCNHGTDLPGDAVIHHCLKHPWLEGRVIVRSGDPVEGSRTMAVFGVPSHSWRTPIDFGVNYRELLYFVKVVESGLSSEEDAPEVEQVEQAGEDEAGAPEEPDEPDEPEEPSEEKKETAEQEKEEEPKEFHGFVDEERREARQQTECIVIESDGEEEPPKEEAAQQPAQELNDNEEEVQDGLFGRQLYMCGNLGCDETAETSSEFRDHLLMCDLARDSRLLTCRHCGKNMKHVANLMDHLRVHGVKRFSCGLCSYRSHVACQVKKHMKSAHKTAVVDEVSTGHGPGPAVAENALFSYYPREMVAKLRLRPRQKSAKSRSYTCDDVASIPRKSIFSSPVRCAHCGYSSKIRSNMARHLSLHRCTDSSAPSSENEEIVPKVMIPHRDPVNPVPVVENPSKGRMFDKMANLAGSSHETPPERDRERDRERASQPAFVPDHQRFICGADGCSYLTISEGTLKAHLTTLHKSGLLTCPHCANEGQEPMTVDAYRAHLKMHGPRLYRCGHCVFYHFQLSEMDGHLAEKHPNRPPWRYIIREPEDKEVRKQNSRAQEAKASAPWACGLCKVVAGTLQEMQAHAETVHAVKSQYKCAVCPVRCNVRSEFERHFSSKHPNQEVQVLTLFYKKEDELKETAKEGSAVHENPEPLWKKNGYRMRHIRGILLDENELTEAPEDGAVERGDEPGDEPGDAAYGPYGSPSNGQLVCPKCNNYRATYGREMKVHLYRELDYKKYLCSVCSEGFSSRPLCLKHIEKSHPASGAFIREISYNASLENWVDQVIKHQTNALKAVRLNTSKVSSKKIVSPAPSAPASPIKSPVKAKKTVNPVASPFTCLACKHVAQSQQALEEHVRASHADGGIVCLECGFKALTVLAIANHQNRTKHSKTMEPPEVKQEPADPTEVVQESKPKEKQTKPRFQCKHCKFSAPTEHSMNLHWQTRHSTAKLPLEFTCSSSKGARTIIYKCQYCNAKPALYDEMHEHSRNLHPELPIKLFRVAAKVKTEVISDNDEPTAKKQRDDLTTPIQLTSAVTISLSPSKRPRAAPSEAVPSVTITPKAPEPPALIPAPSRQEVFVVAPQKSQQKRPTYTCVWCTAQFAEEAQVIRHHSTHMDKVPLRYTCVDASKTDGAPELIIMEIHFNCPVCTKSFMSLALATRHVREHKQAWKCCHCVKLFLTPVDALTHMREVHPGVQGRLESIDSPAEVFEKLSKGILCSRVQLKKSPSGQVKELSGGSSSTSSASTVAPPPPPKLTQAVAKKSTTTNAFLKEHSAGPSQKND